MTAKTFITWTVTFCLFSSAWAAQGKSGKSPAKPPAKPASPPASPVTTDKATQAMQHITDLELLTTLNKLNMSKEQVNALIAALEEAWAARKKRNAEEDVALAALEETLRQARAAMIGGQLLPAEYLNQLNAYIDNIMFTTQQVEAQILRNLTAKVNNILSGGQLERVLPPMPPPPTAPSAPTVPGAPAAPRLPMTQNPFGGQGGFGGLNEPPDVSLARLRALPPEQYNGLRQILAGAFSMAPMSPEERAERETLLANLDRIRQMSDAQFEREREALGAAVREQATYVIMGDMLRNLRAAPPQILDAMAPTIINMVLSEVDPNSPEYTEMREQFTQFIQRVRSLSPEEFARERINLLREMDSGRRRLEETVQVHRTRRQQQQVNQQATEHWRKAMENFVQRTLMNPRTLVLLKERVQK
ncbi:MAG: hypothetical protein NZT92_05965 [Abditibacteriales bacterium]|nr:hypothetical protein [Abditibacteriales bacterium]MDW8365714.1 hypothetical protein [Abditibacteriales bacterium]